MTKRASDYYTPAELFERRKMWADRIMEALSEPEGRDLLDEELQSAKVPYRDLESLSRLANHIMVYLSFRDFDKTDKSPLPPNYRPYREEDERNPHPGISDAEMQKMLEASRLPQDPADESIQLSAPAVDSVKAAEVTANSPVLPQKRRRPRISDEDDGKSVVVHYRVAGKILGRSAKQIERYVNSGELIRDPSTSSRLVTRASLNDFVKRHGIQPEKR